MRDPITPELRTRQASESWQDNHSGSCRSTLKSISEASTIATSYPREPVLEWLSQHVPELRLKHILRVEQMAIALAHHHQVDVQRAGQAGLLHDLAKYFKPERLLQMAREAGLEIDPVDEANPHLLHAEVSAIVAKTELGIRDEAVLEAIRNHTLGRPGMSRLSCVVFLADSLEPGRGNTPELETLRQASWQDLYQGVWLTCEQTIHWLFEQQRLVHPRVILTRNWAMPLAKQQMQAANS
ncbi:bis(5'-nucleosyl)-tetraphosphatase (symmetrical) YqeK [Pantanalinema rosaneae CENA516]|uniref:bis(5'-nucleosyl)-tetraphosphatase (symmetrical) YqeK n=1 Tax=Pantanalinema rosaneae TaxID=1620701 RepID=UPI003D6EF0C6